MRYAISVFGALLLGLTFAVLTPSASARDWRGVPGYGWRAGYYAPQWQYGGYGYYGWSAPAVAPAYPTPAPYALYGGYYPGYVPLDPYCGNYSYNVWRRYWYGR